jgi:anti-sigma B factor antagonist
VKTLDRGLRLSRRTLADVVVLELHGRLDAALDRGLLQALGAHLEKGERRIVVDCAGLEYLGSRGVSAFIAVIDDLRGRGGDLKLAAVPSQAALVLDRLGVSRLIQRFATAGEAAAAFEVPIEEFLKDGGLDTFVSSEGGRIFHASGCTAVRAIRRVVTYVSKKQARDGGLRPCRKCCC